tara:strand:- start:2483 stop:2839 length:357 start_codon:yes stop_codon:yes gene_type:complete
VVALSFLFLTGFLPKKVQAQPKIADICKAERALAKKAATENIAYIVIFDKTSAIKNNEQYEKIEQKFRIFDMKELHKLIDNFNALVEYISCLHRTYGEKEKYYDFDEVNRNADGLKME